MVDYQRQLLDELMGRNRNLDMGQKAKEKTWKDPDNCKFFMVNLRVLWNYRLAQVQSSALQYSLF